MATKKKSDERALVKNPIGGALAEWEKELSVSAEDAQAMFKAAGGSAYVTMQQGHFTFQNEIVDDQMLSIIVLGIALDNAYYPDEFNRDNPVPPACWALEELTPNKDAEAVIAPPADVPDKQSERCVDCWANKWASGGRGRGKACKNAYRMVLAADVSAEALVNPESVIDVARMRVPPTSMKFWAGYARQLGKMYRKAPWGVISQFKLEMVANATYSHIRPAFVRLITKEEAPRVVALRQTVLDELLQPYDTSGYEEKKASRGATKARGPARGPAPRATAPAPAGRGLGGRGGATHGGKTKY